MPKAADYGAGLITVTIVRVSSDLSVAKAYLSIFGGKKSSEEVIEAIEHDKGEIRMLLASKIRMRFVPNLNFYLDDTLDEIDKIKDLTEKASKDEVPIDESKLRRK